MEQKFPHSLGVVKLNWSIGTVLIAAQGLETGPCFGDVPSNSLSVCSSLSHAFRSTLKSIVQVLAGQKRLGGG